MSAVLAMLPGSITDPALPPAWQGRVTNDNGRSLSPALRVGLVRTDGAWPWRDDPRLAPLIDAVPNVAFRSLRHHELARQVPVSPPDLVITLDAGTAHLAALRGWPVWLLAPYGHGCRTTPCHGGVRVFAQPRPSGWGAPLARMAAELAAHGAAAGGREGRKGGSPARAGLVQRPVRMRSTSCFTVGTKPLE